MDDKHLQIAPNTIPGCPLRGRIDSYRLICDICGRDFRVIMLADLPNKHRGMLERINKPRRTVGIQDDMFNTRAGMYYHTSSYEQQKQDAEWKASYEASEQADKAGNKDIREFPESVDCVAKAREGIK